MRGYFLKFIAAIICLIIMSACVSYRVPTISAGIGLNLTMDDVDLLGETTGRDWAFGIFPLWLVGPAATRATQYAIGKATRIAYDQSGSDFIIQPKTKTIYYNFILFDYAEAEAIGEAVRIKKKKK